eukprot:scaffold167147_cov12-Tisochrysis_lutea.AAC.1
MKYHGGMILNYCTFDACMAKSGGQNLHTQSSHLGEKACSGRGRLHSLTVPDSDRGSPLLERGLRSTASALWSREGNPPTGVLVVTCAGRIGTVKGG